MIKTKTVKTEKREEEHVVFTEASGWFFFMYVLSILTAFYFAVQYSFISGVGFTICITIAVLFLFLTVSKKEKRIYEVIVE